MVRVGKGSMYSVPADTEDLRKGFALVWFCFSWTKMNYLGFLSPVSSYCSEGRGLHPLFSENVCA